MVNEESVIVRPEIFDKIQQSEEESYANKVLANLVRDAELHLLKKNAYLLGRKWDEITAQFNNHTNQNVAKKKLRKKWAWIALRYCKMIYGPSVYKRKHTRNGHQLKTKPKTLESASQELHNHITSKAYYEERLRSFEKESHLKEMVLLNKIKESELKRKLAERKLEQFMKT